MWHDEQFAHLESVQHRTEVTGDAVERKIQTLLEPVCDAVSPFGHAIERVVGNEAAREARRLQSIERVIVVKFKIKDAGVGNLGVVDLDFVGLSKSTDRPSYKQDRDDSR